MKKITGHLFIMVLFLAFFPPFLRAEEAPYLFFLNDSGQRITETPQYTNRSATIVWDWLGRHTGNFSYKLTIDGSAGSWSDPTTTSLDYSIVNPAEGTYVFGLKEAIEPVGFSDEAFFTVVVDRTAPAGPQVSSVPMTIESQPLWEWSGSGGGAGVFRIGFVDSTDLQVVTTTSFKPAAALDEGRHVLCVSERDYAYNWSPSSCSATLIDRMAPFPPYVFAESPVSLTLPRWEWSSGGGGGSGFFRYAINSAALESEGTVTSATGFMLPADQELTNPGEQKSYTLYVQERDELQNWSVTSSVTVTVDKIPPLSPSLAAISPTSASLWEWSGNGGGAGQFRYCLQALDCNSLCSLESATVTAAQNLSLSFLTDGLWSIRLQERDVAGNWSSPVCREQILDRVAPAKPSFQGSAISSSSYPVWSWYSNGGGAEVYRYGLNDADLRNEPEYADMTSFTPRNPLQDGAHILYLQERDAAGNWSESASFAVTVDTLAPNPPQLSPLSVIGDSRPLWRWQAMGGGAGIFRLYIDSVLVTEVSTTEYKATTDLENGVHLFSVQERDEVFNWSPLESAEIEVDLLPPPPPSPVVGKLTNNRQPVWLWSGSSDGNGIFQYNLNSNDFTQNLHTETTNLIFRPSTYLEEGEHTLYVRERDVAGNWSVPASATVTIDITAPEAPLVELTNGDGSPFPVWSWSSTDETAAGYFRYSTDLQSLSSQSETTFLSYCPLLPLPMGIHTLHVQERDAAGNWSAVTTASAEVIFELKKGWVLAGGLDYSDMDDFFRDFDTVDIVWSYEDANWSMKPAPGVTEPGNYAELQSLKPQKGYLLKPADDMKISLSSNALNISLPGELRVGWQLIGGYRMDVSEFFQRYPAAREIFTISKDGNLEIVNWMIAQKGGNTSSQYEEITHLEPQNGYWVRVGSEQDRWIQLQSGGEPRARHTATVCNGRIFFFGGYNSNGFSDTLDIFDPFFGTWTKGSAAGLSRYGHSAACYNDEKLFVFGGENSQGISDSLQIYDIATDEWAYGPSGPYPRRGHKAFICQENICQIGGQGIIESGEIRFINGIDGFSPETNQWSSIPDKGLKRAFFSLSTEGERFFHVWGGIGPEGSLNQLVKGDVKADASNLSLSPGSAVGTIRNFHAAAFWNGFLFLHGGEDINGQTRDLLELVDIRKEGSQNGLSGGIARSEHSMAFYQNRFFVWGGRDREGRFLNSLYMYSPAGAMDGRVNQSSVIPSVAVSGGSGDLTVTFNVCDEESDFVTISGLEYSFDYQEWHSSTSLKGQQRVFLPGQDYSLLWDSAADLQINTEPVFLRLLFSDGENSAHSVISPAFKVTNNSVPQAIALTIAGNSDKIPVSFHLYDEDGDILSFALQWAENNGLNEGWTAVQSVSVETSGYDLENGLTEIDLLWDSLQEIAVNTAGIALRVMAYDGKDYGFSTPLTDITIHNGPNNPPRITNLQAMGEAEDIFLSFNLADADDDLSSISLDFYLNNVWHSSFATEGKTTSLFPGSGHRLLWHSRTDIETDEERIRVRICPSDSRPGTPVCAVSEDFRVLNANQAPKISDLTVSGNRADLLINFTTFDAERNNMYLMAEFSTDGGHEWHDIPPGHLSGDMIFLVNGPQSLIWHSEKTFSSSLDNVKLRLRVFDGLKSSEPVESAAFFLHNAEQWNTISYLRGGRIGGTADLIDDYVILTGGIDGDGRLVSRIDEWNLNDNTMTVKGNLAQARLEHSSVRAGDNLYLFGGMNSDPRVLSSLEIFNFDSGTTPVTKSSTYLRTAHEAVLYKEVIYIWGGDTGSVIVKDLIPYNSKTGAWLSTSTGGTSRMGHSATVYNDSMYVWGGKNRQGALLNSMNIYNFTNKVWSTAQSGGTPRMAHTALLHDGRIYFFGGDGQSGPLDSLDIYDVALNKWTAGNSSGRPRRNHNAFIRNGRMWYIGGADSYGTLESTVDVYTPEKRIITTNHPPEIIEMRTEYDRGEAAVHFTARDADGDYLYPFLEYTVNDKEWQQVSPNRLNLSNAVFLSDSPGYVIWNSLSELSDCNLQIRLRLTVSDGDIGFSTPAVSDEFAVCNSVNSEPGFRSFSAENNNGLVSLSFEIYDADQDKMNVKSYYAFASGSSAGLWHEMSALEGTKTGLLSGIHELIWLSPLEVDSDASLNLKMEVEDGRLGVGSTVVLSDLLILSGQEQVPVISNIQTKNQDDNMQVSYELSGTDISSLLFQFSLDQGKNWQNVNSNDLNLTADSLSAGSDRKIYWNSVPYIEKVATDVLLRLLPVKDNREGVRGISDKLHIENGGYWESNFGAGRLREAHSSVIHNSRIYFFGGVDESGSIANSIDIYDTGTGFWTVGSSGGTPRRHHSAVIYNGRMYVWGGWTASGRVNSMDIYDIASDTWLTGSSGGTARHSHQALVFDGKMFIFGGSGLNGGLNQVEIFNLEIGIWRSGESGGKIRYGHSCAALNNQAICTGGKNSSGPVTGVDIFDLSSETWQEPQTGFLNMVYGTAAALPGGVIFHGGQDEQEQLSAVTAMLDYSGKWRYLSDSNYARSGLSATVSEGKIYYWGGMEKQGLSDKLEVFLPPANMQSTTAENITSGWEIVLSDLSGRFYHNMVSRNQYIWFIGGRDINSELPLNNMSVYNRVNSSFTEQSGSLIPRNWAAADNWRDKLLVFGGINGSGQVTASLEQYEISSGIWTELNPALEGRYQHTAVVYGNSLYVWGGLNESHLFSGRHDIFDLLSGLWRRGPETANYRCQHSATLLHGRIYYWGGRSRNGKVLNSLDIYDADSGAWLSGESGGQARYGHSAFLRDGRIWFTGGLDEYGLPVTKIDIYDPGTGKWLNPVATEDKTYSFHSAWPQENKICIFGGLSAFGIRRNSLECFQPEPETGYAWKNSTAPVQERYAHAGVYHKGRLYYWGGRTKSGLSDQVDIYEPSRDEWSTGISGGKKRKNSSVISHLDKIYYFGGEDVNGQALNDVDIYEPQTWVSGPVGGIARKGHSAVLTNRKIYLWGGLDENGSGLTFTDIFDLQTNSWSSSISGEGSLRSGHISVAHRGYIWHWGGYSGIDLLRNLERYNPQNNAFTSITFPGVRYTPRHGHTGNMVGDKLYIFGGSATHPDMTQVSLNSLDILDLSNPSNPVWQSPGAGGISRIYHASCVVGDKIYFFGGYNEFQGVLNKTDIYDTVTGIWTEAPTGGIPRFAHSAVYLNGKIFLFGGYDQNKQILRTMDIFDPAFLNWSQGEMSDQPRAEHIAIGDEETMRILHWGGNSSDGINSSMEIYRILSFTEGKNNKNFFSSGDFSRINAVGAFYEGRLFFAGGRTSGGSLCRKDAGVYNLNTGQWESNIGFLEDRCDPSLTVFNDRMYLWGGSGNGINQYPRTLEVYDFEQKQWIMADGDQHQPAGRYNHSSALLGDKIIYYGGDRALDEKPIIYDIGKDAWYTGLPAPEQRKWASMSTVDDKIFVLGGIIEGRMENTNDVLIYDQQEDHWEYGMRGGLTRREHTAVVSGHTIYIWGGIDDQRRPLNNLEAYNTASSQWMNMGDGGNKRSQHSAVITTDHKIFFWGGIGEGGDRLNSLNVYDITQQLWYQGVPGGTARYNHTAVIYNNKIYIWGGMGPTGVLNTMDIYDIEEGLWSAGRTGGLRRQGARGEVYDGRIYYFGGEDGWGIRTNEVEIYDIATDSWSEASIEGKIRAGHAADQYLGEIYYHGGSNRKGVSGTMDIYDIINKRWRSGPTGNTQRTEHASVVYNGRIYYHGGMDNSGNVLNTMDIFDLTSAAYTEAVTVPTARYGHQAAEHLGIIYFFGGRDENGFYRQDIDAFDVSTQTWRILSLQTDKRAFFAAVNINDRIYMAGGSNDGLVVSTGLLLHLPGGIRPPWSEGRSGGVPRSNGSAVEADGLVYLWGGVDNNGSLAVQMDVFSLDTEDWIESIPFAAVGGRYGQQALLFNGRIYYVGGRDSNGELIDHIDVFNISDKSWTTISVPRNYRRFSPGLSLYQDKFWQWGGVGINGLSRDVDIFNPLNDGWSTIFGGGHARREHTANLVGNTIHFFGGRDSESGLLSIMDNFQPSLSGNQAPTVSDFIIDGKSGDINLILSLSDPNGDPISLRFEYLKEGSWQLISTSHFDSTMNDLPSGTKQFNWFSGLDIFDQRELQLRVQAFDGQLRGEYYYSTVFEIDNSQQWEAYDLNPVYSQQAVFPVTISYHATTNYQDRIQIYGGIGNNGPVRTMLEYEPTASGSGQGTWRYAGSGIVERYGHTANRIDNRMFVFGGYNTKSLRSMEICTLPEKRIIDGTFSDLECALEATAPDSVTARHFHSSAVYGNLLVFYGGRDDFGALNSIQFYDTVQKIWSTGPDSSVYRYGHDALVVGDRMYVYGGRDQQEQLSNDMHIFDFKADKWFVGASADEARTNIRAFERSGQLYFHGGSDNYGQYKNSFLIYDTGSGRWNTEKISGGTGRGGHGISLIGEWVYIFGGFNPGLTNRFDMVQIK